ncbi:MAG: hypothetical protein Tsb002_15410 [Wenzhouxiangellaceae bacterium]
MFKPTMSEIIQTQTGTFIEDGVEFNQYPPPSTLVKAMEFKWATNIIETGSLRLNSTSFYQNLESKDLGDFNEGRGMFKMNGHEMNVGTINDVYIWCSALPDTSKEVLLSLEESYNCIITINDTLQFVKRVSRALKDKGLKMWPHIGTVKYSRGKEVSKEALNSQKFNYNIFQKADNYSHHNEFRISFMNVTTNKLGTNPIDIEIGNCKELVTIERT